MSSVRTGHRYERAYAEVLRNRGYRVQRSAASKGLFDLTATKYVSGSWNGCVHVQCKAGPLSCTAARAYADTLGSTVPPSCTVRVCHRTKTDEYCEHDA